MQPGQPVVAKLNAYPDWEIPAEVIAVIPTAVNAWLGIPFQITAFLGGTGLLIVVSVALDMVQRIEANLLMRNYGGFLSGPGQKGRRIKGRQY